MIGNGLEKVYAEYVDALAEFQTASSRLTTAKASLRAAYVSGFRSGLTERELAMQVPGIRPSTLTDFRRAIAPFWKEHCERFDGADDAAYR